MKNKNKIKLVVPMDRPIAVFTLDTDLEADQVLDTFQHCGWDYFINMYEYTVYNSSLIPNTEDAYIQEISLKPSGESNG
jgi:hypothetical protein